VRSVRRAMPGGRVGARREMPARVAPEGQAIISAI
jgi:hypothetical protein